VILNLALWFALHSLFAEARPFAAGPVRFDLPVLASVNWPALLLTVVAVFAIFRLKVGPMIVLAGCAATGLVYGVVA
jgi:chromate transporter